MTDLTLGEKLVRLKERSGLSLANIARAAGYRNASSIQRYFDPTYEAEYLPSKVAARLKAALTGFGDPVVTESDVDELTEFGFELSRRSFHLPPSALQRRESFTIECNPSVALGAYHGDIELFSIGDDPLVAFVKGKELSARPIHAFYASTPSLTPRIRIGEVVFYEDERPPLVGSDVLVLLEQRNEAPAQALLAVFHGRDREGIALETFDPPMRFKMQAEEVDAVYPLLTASDLLAQHHPRESYVSG